MSAEPVFTLRDLESWSRPGLSLAVLGHPIKHSISPAMHNAALAELARADSRYADWRYFRFEIHPADLPHALTLLHAKKFHGINLTVPHKIIAFDRVAEVDPAARPVGAVNTLLFAEHGWRGFNTDGYGLAAAVRETLGRELAGAHIILLGAGGAARGAAVECLQRGCASLAIANRTRENLDALLATLKGGAPMRGTVFDETSARSRAAGPAKADAPLAGKIPVRGFAPTAVPTDLAAHALVINATSAGLKASDPLPIELTALPRPAAVFDMIYNPPQTPLLRAAAALGLPHANGLAMLVHQGAKALEIWSGVPATRTAPTMAEAANAALT